MKLIDVPNGSLIRISGCNKALTKRTLLDSDSILLIDSNGLAFWASNPNEEVIVLEKKENTNGQET